MNIYKLKEYLNCDNNFLASLAEKFIEEVSEMSKRMEEDGRNEKWEMVRMNAHKMLSSVRIFEIEELVGILERIEINIDEGADIKIVKEDLVKLTPLIQKTMLEMKHALKELRG